MKYSRYNNKISNKSFNINSLTNNFITELSIIFTNTNWNILRNNEISDRLTIPYKSSFIDRVDKYRTTPEVKDFHDYIDIMIETVPVSYFSIILDLFCILMDINLEIYRDYDSEDVMDMLNVRTLDSIISRCISNLFTTGLLRVEDIEELCDGTNFTSHLKKKFPKLPDLFLEKMSDREYNMSDFIKFIYDIEVGEDSNVNNIICPLENIHNRIIGGV